MNEAGKNRSDTGRTAVYTRPPLRLRCRLAAIGLGLSAWLVYRFLAIRPELAERLVGSGPIAELPRYLSLASGAVPFPLAELVVLVVVVRQLLGIVAGTRDLRTGRDALPRTLVRGGLRLLHDVGILLALFYLLWGFQYARPGLDAQMGLPERGMVPPDELATIGGSLVDRTNALYRGIHGEDDRGLPTPGGPISPQIAPLEQGWERVARRWDLPDRYAAAHGAPRPFLATPVVRFFRIAGMYFPYTGEALVMRDLPGAARGKDLAHEMAHQRGVARESDANTLGYLVAIESPELQHRYSAAIFLQRQFIAALAQTDPAAALELIARRLPGVQRDVDAIRAYWDRSRGPVGSLARRANDAMLRSHGIAEGVASYGGSVWLLTALARREGLESILPDPDARPSELEDDPALIGHPGVGRTTASSRGSEFRQTVLACGRHRQGA